MIIKGIDTEVALRELTRRGISIFRGAVSKRDCDTALCNLKSANSSVCVKGQGNDIRIHKMEAFCPVAKCFLNNVQLNEICESYVGPITRKRCQGGLVEYEAGKDNCSGGGWHVDNHNPQFKALLYLTDVDENSGPFVFLPNTYSIHREVPTYPNFPGDTSETRYKEDILKNYGFWHLKQTVLGKAGDVILVDTSNIHRGSEIKQGFRGTLTNYYFHD